MTIYSLDVLLFWFGTSLLFRVCSCCFLTCIQVFLRRQVRWPDIPISWRIVHSLLWSTQSKALEAEVDVFLELSCFFYDSMDVGNLISGSSAFSKSSLYIWKFSVPILLKPSLRDFEHYLASMWNHCNCTVVWATFGIAFLGDWNENWTFPGTSLVVLWLRLCAPHAGGQNSLPGQGTISHTL